LTFLDVAEIARDLRGKVAEHTPEQEQYLAAHPQHLLIFEYFRDGGYSLEELCAKYNLDQESVDMYLADLEKQGLVELYPNGRAKPLIDHVRWRRGGALRETFGPGIAKIYSQATQEAVMRKDEHQDPNLYIRGSVGILMRPETMAMMQQEIDELEKKYRALSKTEVPLERKENLRWVLYSFLVTARDVRDQLYEVPKNRSQLKKPTTAQPQTAQA